MSAVFSSHLGDELVDIQPFTQELGETIEAAAARELQEESGLSASALDKRGLLRFQFLSNMAEVRGSASPHAAN